MSHSLKVNVAKALMMVMIGASMSGAVWAEDMDTAQELVEVVEGTQEAVSETQGVTSETPEATNEASETVNEKEEAAVNSEEVTASLSENSEEAVPEKKDDECLSSDIIKDDTTGLSEKLAQIKSTLPMNRPLWIAGNFNFFIFDTHEMTNGDSEGRVAVGKQAIYSQYGIAQKITTEADGYPVSVVLGNGGSFSLTGGDIKGNIITDHKENVTLENASVGDIDEVDVNNELINFEELQQKYTVLSYFLTLKVPTGTVSYNEYNKNCLELRASDDADKMVVFTLPEDVTSLGEIQISNIDMEKQPTIVINSLGNAIGQTAQMMINGSSELAKSYAGRILWNLPLAQPGNEIPVAGTIYGSVLAPTGDFRVAGWGNIEGTFIANSFISEGCFEGHNNPFIGKLPPITCPDLAELEYWMGQQK